MSDELVERLLDWPYQGETMAHEAAARIKALTAERDRAYTSGYSDAETEISKSALGQDNTFLHSRYANAKLRIEQLTEELDKVEAENERMRDALFTWIDMMNDPSTKLRRKVVEFYSIAIAALK